MVKAKARLEQVEEKIRGEMEMASMNSYFKGVCCRRTKIRKRLTWLFFLKMRKITVKNVDRNYLVERGKK